MQTPILSKFFDEWAASCFGANWRTEMPANERSEREKAFFSGFASYYFFSMQAAGLSDAEAEKQLAAVNAEIQGYFAQFKRTPERN